MNKIVEDNSRLIKRIIKKTYNIDEIMIINLEKPVEQTKSNCPLSIYISENFKIEIARSGYSIYSTVYEFIPKKVSKFFCAEWCKPYIPNFKNFKTKQISNYILNDVSMFIEKTEKHD